MELCLEMWRFCRPFLEKQFPCRVCALGTTWYGNCFSRNGVNGSFAPIEWLRKGSRNSDSTNKRRNFSTCFLSGEQHTPATGVNKCSNPDEGTLNEVSSLANEKFISSRNKYGLKESVYLLAFWKPDTAFRCVGLHIKWMSWSLRIINWPVEESTVEKSTLNNLRVKQRLDIGISGS